MDTFPRDLQSYNLKLNNNIDILICELEYESKIFYSEISTSDLKSGLVSLTKLSNIIKSNHRQTQPDFTIWLDLIPISNERTNTNNLVLNIIFSSEFIEFEEKIYFREKSILLNNVEKNVKLEQLVKSQSEDIKQLKNTILQMSNIIERLENRLDKLVSEQYYIIPKNSNELNSIPKIVNELILKSICDPNNTMNFLFCAVFNYEYMFCKCDYQYKLPLNCDNFVDNFGRTFYHPRREKHIRFINCGGYEEDEITYNNRLKEFKLNMYYEVLSVFLFFDIKKLTLKINDENISLLDKIKTSKAFINFYLGKKKDFVVEEIQIDNNQLVNTLIKYTNYNKLLIKYDKDFNDNLIKNHCVSNNIEFGYV
jgi:hypothetical protein